MPKRLLHLMPNFQGPLPLTALPAAVDQRNVCHSCATKSPGVHALWRSHLQGAMKHCKWIRGKQKTCFDLTVGPTVGLAFPQMFQRFKETWWNSWNLFKSSANPFFPGAPQFDRPYWDTDASPWALADRWLFNNSSATVHCPVALMHALNAATSWQLGQAARFTRGLERVQRAVETCLKT